MPKLETFIIRFSNYFSQYLSTRIIFVMDMILSVVSSVLILLLASFFPDAFGYCRTMSLIWIVSATAGSAVSFLVTRSYRVIIRHSSIKDIARFLGASSLKVCVSGFLFLVLCHVICIFFGTISSLLILLLLDFLLTSFLVVAVRVLMIMTYNLYSTRFRDMKKTQRVLVYSTNDRSVATVARVEHSSQFKIVGFLSSDSGKRMFKIGDLDVYTFTDMSSIQELRRSHYFDAILFSSEDALQKESDRLVDYAIKNKIKVLLSPSIDEVKSSSVNHFSVREVNIEDLLGREEIKISMDEIRSHLNGKTVMVTGAAGSIGSELCRQIAGFDIEKLVLFDNAETPMHNLRLELEEKFPNLQFVPVIGDVRHPARLDYAFNKFRPVVVFHAAAYKHVPLMEENPCEAVLVNVAGTRNVADKCLEYGVHKMVMISTDKAVNPTNIMGCTKRLAEIYVQSLGLAVASGKVAGCTRFVTTRFGNVLGSNGSVIPRFREQLLKGGPLTVTHPDINRFFMTIPEACRLVMEAATLPTENRICVFDMGKPVKIDSLARRMIELAGYVPDKDIKIVYTGLRPGEKLYEEVLSTVEGTDPTSHDRIRIAHVRSYDYDDAAKVVNELEVLSREVRIPEMVRLMKQTVPEYISNNSKFSEFDVKPQA